VSKRVEGLADIVGDRDCGGDAPPRFPIWGALRLGDEIRSTSDTGAVQPGLLIEGRLRIQAQAITSAFVFFERDAIYNVADLDLPTGSRVESVSDANGSAAWWGVAYVDPQKIALQVAASTESKAFAVYRPGSTAAQTVTVTGLTQLFADPNVFRFQTFVVVFLGILQLAVLIWPFRDASEKEK